MNLSPTLSALSDLASEAHRLIQQDYANINPVISLSRAMRKNGVPADAMTIDCFHSGKRIILILHDQQPDIVSYQFCLKDKDPLPDFEHMAFDEFTTQVLYDWMSQYFSEKKN